MTNDWLRCTYSAPPTPATAPEMTNAVSLARTTGTREALRGAFVLAQRDDDTAGARATDAAHRGVHDDHDTTTENA